MRGIKNDFGSSIPSSYDVLSEGGSCFFIASGQTEITNFHVTILVEQDITWLQVSVDDVRGVNIKAASK